MVYGDGTDGCWWCPGRLYLNVVLVCSHINVLRWETGIHTGSSGCGDAAFDGAESIANITDANSYTVPLSLSMAHRFCHEYPTKANIETGNISMLNLFDILNMKTSQKVSAITNWLNSMELNPWEAASCLALQEFPTILWNLKGPCSHIKYPQYIVMGRVVTIDDVGLVIRFIDFFNTWTCDYTWL